MVLELTAAEACAKEGSLNMSFRPKLGPKPSRCQNTKKMFMRRLPNFCNVSTHRNNQIKLTHHDETEKKDPNAQTIRAEGKPLVEPQWAQPKKHQALTHR